MRVGTLAPTGTLTLTTLPRVTRAPLLWRLKNLPHLLRGVPGVVAAWTVFYLFGIPSMLGSLRLRVINRQTGRIVDYGIVGYRVVTTAGVNAIVDAFQNTVEVDDFKYHGFGTGGSAEAVGNTALTTELTTEYATNNTRPTGSATEGATANIYRTVGTLSPDANCAITEHGIFSATSAGTLLDRTLFSVVNLTSVDSLQASYELTFTAGS